MVRAAPCLAVVRAAPSVAVALLVAAALAHAVQAGTNLDEERSQLGAISSKIEELKKNFIHDLRNRGKNKHRKGRKNSGHRRKKAGQRKNKSAKQKKKSTRGRKKVGQRNKSRGHGNKSGARGNKSRGRGNKSGGRGDKSRGRGNKSAKPRRKAGQNRRGKMASGNFRQTCDEQALCQKIKDFIKISNQLRKVKRIIKVCSLMENKAQKSATEFEATISSLTSALAVSRTAGGPGGPGRHGGLASRQNTTEVDDVTSIRDKLNNCSDTIKTKCDKTTVEGCQNATFLTQCEAELMAWTTKFGPAKGSCLQKSKDCCACITALPDVSAPCLAFDKLTDLAVKKKSKCTSGNSEGSFGYCRKLQQEAAIKGPTVAKLHCETSTTTTTTSAPLNTTLHITTMMITTPVDLSLNVTSLEASVVTLLDTVGSLTTKVEAITIKVDANTAKGVANAAAIADKCDASTCSTIQAANTKLESCLGDVSSSDCPTVATGKTGVAAVSANLAALTNKCDATKCTSVETKVTDVESCLSDTTSAKCPSAAGKVSIPGAITALETPTVFSCYNTPEFVGPTSGSETKTMAPYGSCVPNVGTVVDLTSGKFTVAKAGKYRLTFMCLMLPIESKKAIAIMTKTTGVTETKLARALSQSKIGPQLEQITTTIDIIVELAVADTVHVAITLSGNSNGQAKIAASNTEPYQVFFTGEFISA